jgi:high affinity Mn2+ porin
MFKTKFILLSIILASTCLNVMGQKSLSDSSERFSVHVQATVVNQTKPEFSAPYTGQNSLQTLKENRTSITSTLYLGARLWQGASAFINPEIAGGSGLSDVLGLASATNGETFRIGSSSPKIYVARLYFQQRIRLNSERGSTVESDFNQLKTVLPEKYLNFTVGKISMADFFDKNTYSHDPRTQFLNWALMSNGAWDYPANTRGYAPSAILEYVSPKNELRYAFSLLPKMANGNDMDWNIKKSGSHTIEFTHNHAIANLTGAARILGFYTSANMGSYNEAIAQNPSNPDILLSRSYAHKKYGVGINLEQQINHDAGVFFRSSINDGHNETWVFTEIDRSISSGLVYDGTKWARPSDKFGVSYVMSGLSSPHRNYLAAGGYGFMIGDGKINYAAEKVGEIYYKTELKEGIYVTADYQNVRNPGYNHDRKGPVNVYSIRTHIRI